MLKLEFEDGSTGKVDLSKYVEEGTVFDKLKDFPTSKPLGSSTGHWSGGIARLMSPLKLCTKTQQARQSIMNQRTVPSRRRCLAWVDSYRTLLLEVVGIRHAKRERAEGREAVRAKRGRNPRSTRPARGRKGGPVIEAGLRAGHAQPGILFDDRRMP